MKTQISRFTLYAVIVYLTGATLNPAVAASQPTEGNGAHFCGVIDYPPDDHWYAKSLNSNYAQAPAAANLNVGDPYTVRLIYFRPSDRQPRPYINAQMDTLIKRVQQGYANDMERHGFGRKTFTFEADPMGNAVVHHVNGQFTADYYEHETFDKVRKKVNEQFDTLQNIYLIVVDSGYLIDGAGGQATLGDGGGGTALIHGIGDIINKVYLAAHELGHTFGLRHDFRNDAYIMSYGGSNQSQLSKCAAEGLDVHPYFNPTRASQNFNKSTTIGALTARLASLPNTIGLRFEVADFDGLHQARLHTPEVKSDYERSGGFLACKRLTGISSTVEIVTTALEPRNKSVFLQVIDVHGNISWSQRYPINITSLLPPPKVVSTPDGNLAAVVRKHIGEAALTPHAMLNLRSLRATNHRITDLTGLEHAVNLMLLYLGGNSISDISPLADLTNLKLLSLGSNSISDISPLANLTNLTSLFFGNNSISDISPLKGLTNLKLLYLESNSISDISPLANLTHLTKLSLGRNSVSDISMLKGLTHLTKLSLRSNSISDISPLADLTNLELLYLANNSISDISPLADLTNLESLYLWGNSVSDLSPLVANTGLGSGDTVDVRRNPLRYLSIHTHIPTLQNRGVRVLFDNQAHPALLKISGDHQAGIAFTPLSNPYVVEVQDENGSAASGIAVTFTVTTGGGIVHPKITRTDENGRAQNTLTLGNLGANTVSVSAAGIEGKITFHAISDDRPTEYLWAVPAGVSWIHVPLQVTTVDNVARSIKSVADLYDALGGSDTVNFLTTHDPVTQRWHSYLGNSSRDTIADPVLTNDRGIIAVMNNAVVLRLRGDALGTNGSSFITLHPGRNLVGVPLRDSRITHVSDLLALEGIEDNVSAITVSGSKAFKLVRGTGDASDIPIIGGQSFILNAQQAATVVISGDGWYNYSGTAIPPLLSLTGVGVKDTTPVVALTGLIVGEDTGTNSGALRVIVKNLSTDRAVTGDENLFLPDKWGSTEVGYQVTVVDVETGRAARIGDVLEISVRFPSPLIGMQPLRYTVTAEDVLRSRIELPALALVPYEMPSETELLANYPNPFNPETWIPYRLAEEAFVTLTIYDTAGQVVRTLDVGHRIAAVYESRSKAIHWDGRNNLGEQAASGVYFYHFSAGEYSATRRMVILK
ncbi:hypothetical protein C6502_19980 [Candidatus Poribacteria bacterium]|nr:MAG: hypothetical protein C6502_19980 [Candidatus Poribacteria bacterium]